MKSDTPLLQVDQLTIGFGKEDTVPAVDGISFAIEKGQTLGIVGESGSGKSLSSLALMGLLPRAARIRSGSALFTPHGGEALDLLAAPDAAMRRIRGRRISMIFQEPMTSLNPLHTCGRQVAEVMRWHEGISPKEARKRTIALFEEVELPRAESMFDNHPHEISGGQKQRVMIAMALACKPDLLIADEPTTALDVTVQKRILELLAGLKSRSQMGMIFITHDLGVVSHVADQVMVMYRGKAIEHGPAKRVFEAPEQAYTRALIECRPKLEGNPVVLPTVADFMGGLETRRTEVPQQDEAASVQAQAEHQVLLEARDVNVWYPTARNAWGKPTAFLKAVNGVSFDIKRGETLGLVGESGCGKSTLGRTLLRLQDLHSGHIHFAGKEISGYSPREMRPLRKQMQLIFQDPYGSLNPRMTVEQTLEEPIRVHRLLHGKQAIRDRISHILDRVGLPSEARHKYPHEFSGGQRQRICIGRALVVEPEFIVCDESVSALDVSVQAQVLNLLNELKRDLSLTYLFISHDLSVVRFMSDRVAVMQKGEIVELAASEILYKQPASPYTRQLIEAIPAV